MITLTLSDAAISTVAAGVGGSLVWAIKVIANEIVAYIKSSRVTNEQILEIVKDISKQVGLSRDLDIIKRAVLRVNSQAFTCDKCGGWDGPADTCPAHLKMCRCSDPAIDTKDHKA